MTDREIELHEQLVQVTQMRDHWAVRVVDLEVDKYDLEEENVQLRQQVQWLGLALSQKSRTIPVKADPSLYSVLVTPEAAS